MSRNRSSRSGRYFCMDSGIWCSMGLRWIGLTDGKIYEIYGENDFEDDDGWYYQDFGNVIEQMSVVTLEEYLIEISKEQEE